MFNEMGGDQRSLPPNVRELFFFVFDCFFNVFETMSLDFFYISSHEQSPVDSSTAFGLLSESFVWISSAGTSWLRMAFADRVQLEVQSDSDHDWAFVQIVDERQHTCWEYDYFHNDNGIIRCEKLVLLSLVNGAHEEHKVNFITKSNHCSSPHGNWWLLSDGELMLEFNWCGRLGRNITMQLKKTSANSTWRKSQIGSDLKPARPGNTVFTKLVNVVKFATKSEAWKYEPKPKQCNQEVIPLSNSWALMYNID